MNKRIWLALSITLCLSAACAAIPVPQQSSLQTLTPRPLDTATPAQTPTSPPTPPVPGRSTPAAVAPTSRPNTAPAAPLNPSAYSLPKPVGAMQDRLPPPDVPACPGAKSLEKPIDFSWEQRDASDWREVNTRTSQEYWTFYRCDQPPTAAAAFYRQWMLSPLYDWLEDHVEEYPEGTLLVDKKHMEGTKHGYRWVYLWLLPEASNSQVSSLVAVWYDYSPC